MVERLGIPEAAVNDLCSELYSKYGTTMAGMQASFRLLCLVARASSRHSKGRCHQAPGSSSFACFMLLISLVHVFSPGLQAVGHHLDYDDWHDYVHGEPLSPPHGDVSLAAAISAFWAAQILPAWLLFGPRIQSQTELASLVQVVSLTPALLPQTLLFAASFRACPRPNG